MHGQFVWYELLTSDTASALKFYPAITGWGTEEFDQTQYTMWTSDKEPLGGVMQLRPDQLAQGRPSSWVPYIAVYDVDAAVKQVTSLGGSVQFGPRDIPGTGRFAIMTDPQKAVFAIYKAIDDSPGFDGTRKPGRFVWHELLTTDVDAAFDFYRKMFGWEKTTASDMGPDVGMYQMYGMKGAEYGGIFKGTGRTANLPPFWTCYVHVKDVKKAAQTATKLGGQVVSGPLEIPGGEWVAMIVDPQGAAFAVHQNALAPTSTPKARPKAKAKTKKKAKAKTKAKTKAKSKSKSKSKARAKARPSARKQAKARSRPRPRAKAKKKKARRR